ncbi:MAG: BatD family protein [Candidatus Limimorpha sp.]
MRKIGILLLFFMALSTLSAQNDVDFKVICKKNVVVGEQFQVSYELNGEGKNFESPNFNGFEVIGGPFSSSSSSVQIINGSVTKSNTHTYSFYLRAIKEGTFTIPAATITVGRQKVNSTTAEINVTKNPNISTSGGNSSASGTTRDVFLEAIPNKTTAYIGEQITLTYKIYFTIPISNLSISKTPSYSGFWTKDITDNNGTIQHSSIIRDNVEYHVATIQEIVLIPQKAGTLTIDPLDISCIAQIKKERQQPRGYDPFDNFFGDIMGSSYTNIKKEVKSQPINIEVKPLPVNDKPQSFKGAVGQFTFNSKIDKDDMKSNDAFTVTYTVSGKGNIELLELPKPNFPPDFEDYDPKITTNTKNNSYGISGSKKAEYVVIPRVSGDFELQPTEFSYFDPSKGRYVTLYSDKMSIHVEKSENDRGSGVIYAGGQEAIKVIGSDIRHIMAQGNIEKRGGLFFASPLFFILAALIVALFVIALIIYKKVNKFNNNQILVRNKKATKIASQRLKNAQRYLKIKDQGHFYEELSQALWGYISDKLNISRSKLSIETVKEMMLSKNAPEDITNQFVDLLNSCEFARFAPGDPNKKMDELYQKGMEIITKAEKALH